jgi:hypothetical protein
MEYLLRLINGIGNKIFILSYFLNKYPKDTLLIIDQQSHHQRGSAEEKIWYLYPELLNHPQIRFIKWKQYDELKGNIPELQVTNDVFHNIEGFSKAKKWFAPNSEYSYLDDKYDFARGLFVHFRLGDKFIQNYQKVRKGAAKDYIVMKPEYYIKHIINAKGPVYVFSDQPRIAKCLLGDEYIYVDEGVNETMYCFQNARHLVLSESTMGFAALKLNNKRYYAVVPGHFIWEKKLVKTPYFEKSTKLEIEHDKDFILETKAEYEDIIQKCKIKQL